MTCAVRDPRCSRTLTDAAGKLIRKSKPSNWQQDTFALPTLEGICMLPRANGGSAWSPGSYDPAVGDVYVTPLEQPTYYVRHSATLVVSPPLAGSHAAPVGRESGRV